MISVFGIFDENQVEMRISITICLLLLFSMSAVAQDYSTWGEIYDFEVGDEFHYEEQVLTVGFGYIIKIINIEITDKVFSMNNDSITYTQSVVKFTVPGYGGPSYENYNETFTVTDLSTLLLADSVYTDSLYNGRKISYIDESGVNLDTDIKKYVNGCGLAYWFYREMLSPPMEYYYHLTYFSKNGEEWGTPNPVVGISDLKQQRNDIQIYPNPVRDNLQISSSENIEELMICDQYGRLVLSPPSENNTIDVSALEPGMYFLIISTEKGQISKKFIKE